MHSGGSSALYGAVYGSPNKSLEQTFWRNSGGAVKSKPATPEMNNCNATIGESVQVHHSRRRLHLPEFRLKGSYASGQPIVFSPLSSVGFNSPFKFRQRSAFSGGIWQKQTRRL